MKVHLTLPKSWNDLSDTQLKNIAYQLECFHMLIKDTPETLTKHTTALFFQISKELLRHNNWRDIRVALKEIQPQAFRELTKFVYTGVGRTKFISQVKVKGVTYHAPATRLRNTTIAEFAFADVAFYKWRKTQNNIWLSVLCATLYREASIRCSEIDKRKPFIKLAVDKRADAFQTIDIQTKLAIAYSYEGCRNHIAKSFPLIFPKPIITEDAAPKKQKYVSFSEIVLDKIQGDPSKLEATNNTLTYDFLSIYSNDIKKLPKK